MRVNINFIAKSPEELMWTLRDLVQGIGDETLGLGHLDPRWTQSVWTERGGEVIEVGHMRIEEDD